MARKAVTVLRYRVGVSIEPTPLPVDVEDALAADPSIPDGHFVVLCDDRECGQNFRTVDTASDVAKVFLEAWPWCVYSVVRVIRET